MSGPTHMMPQPFAAESEITGVVGVAGSIVISLLNFKGEMDRASAASGEAHKLSDLNSSIARLSAAPGQQWLQRPKIRALAEATYFVGLRKAGMPEE